MVLVEDVGRAWTKESGAARGWAIVEDDAGGWGGVGHVERDNDGGALQCLHSGGCRMYRLYAWSIFYEKNSYLGFVGCNSSRV